MITVLDPLEPKSHDVSADQLVQGPDARPDCRIAGRINKCLPRIYYYYFHINIGLPLLASARLSELGVVIDAAPFLPSGGDAGENTKFRLVSRRKSSSAHRDGDGQSGPCRIPCISFL